MYLDLISIGAINLDCIFFCKKKAYKPQQTEPGSEQWETGIRESLYETINTLRYSSIDYTTQVGGSAFLATKTAHCINPKLRVSYVGVYGTPTADDEKLDFHKNDTSSFNFLATHEWLFNDDSPPGLSVIKLNSQNERDDIDIDPGANLKLVQHIIQHEIDHKTSFVDFLSSARWIHLSSLPDFNQFLYIIGKVNEAKARNPLIRVSIDPGYNYVKNRKSELCSVINIADYIFLNETELGLLIGDGSLHNDVRRKDVSAYFNLYASSNVQVFVTKKPSKTDVYSFQDGNIYTATFWHRVFRKRMIQNDTGAGDAFAGGFIAALLSPQYVVHQPFPAELGSCAACARLKCRKDPFKQISIDTAQISQIMQKRDEINLKQRVQLTCKLIKSNLSSYICGIVTGLAVWVIQIIINLLFN